MATYKTVNADQLDADMTALANTIRTKGGTSGKLAWPAGYKAAVEAIETGVLYTTNDVITETGPWAYYNLTQLVSVSFPELTTLNGGNEFQNCSNLSSVNFPLVTNISTSCFAFCGKLTKVTFPSVATILTSGFNYCSGLMLADFPVVTSIYNFAFNENTSLRSIILRKGSVCELKNTNAFKSTPIAGGNGYIYVPSALVNSYKAATNWSTFAAQFRALESYTVDGTTTGELDPTKTET